MGVEATHLRTLSGNLWLRYSGGSSMKGCLANGWKLPTVLMGLSEGPHFSAKYTVLLNKWRTRLSTALNREVANCIIIEGRARNARGGERLDSNSVAAGSLHLFESIQRRGCETRVYF